MLDLCSFESKTSPNRFPTILNVSVIWAIVFFSLFVMRFITSRCASTICAVILKGFMIKINIILIIYCFEQQYMKSSPFIMMVVVRNIALMVLSFCFFSSIVNSGFFRICTIASPSIHNLMK